MGFLDAGWAGLFGFTVAIGLGMLAMLEFGRRVGQRRALKDPEGAKAGLGPVEASVFGLLGLLIAFTFAGAAARFDKRRELVIQEANIIGDAWARLDTLPRATQPALRDGFRRYLDSRLETYRLLPDLDAAMSELRRSSEIQEEIWSLAVAACATPDGQRATMLVLPALDSMFDMTLLRTAAGFQHPPGAIFGLLFVLALSASFIAGHGFAGKGRSWLPMLGFAIATTIAIYVILDLEFPRVGLIRVDAADRFLLDLRTGMK